MTLFLRLIFLTFLFSVNSFAQQDNALSYQKALISYDNKDYANALEQALHLKEYFVNDNNDKMLFKTLRLIGNCHKSTGNYKKSRSCYLQALEGFSLLNDTTNLITVSNNLSKIYYPLHKFDSVVFYAEKSLQYNKVLKDTAKRAVASYADLVGIYVYQERFQI